MITKENSTIIKNTGIPYEKFVKDVYSLLHDVKNFSWITNSKIVHNHKIVDNCGVERQFDIYWQREENGIMKRSIIECKDYQKGVSIDRVDALIGKMADIPGVMPIMATSNRYHSGALEKARYNNIELLVIREENLEKDWKDSEGRPLIRTITGREICLQPLKIENFITMIDHNDAEKYGVQEGMFIAEPSKVIVGDNRTGERYNLLELEGKIASEIEGFSAELRDYELKFKDGYKEYEGKRIPIKGFRVQYRNPPPFVNEVKFEPVVKAVIEYVLSRQKEILMSLNGRNVVKSIQL